MNATTEKQAATFRDVEKLEATIADLGPRLEALAEEDRSIAGAVTEAHVTGTSGSPEVEQLRARRLAIAAEREELAAALTRLQELVVERRSEALTEACRERQAAIRELRSTTAAERDRRMERLAGHVATVLEELAKIDEAVQVDGALAIEAQAIADQTGVEGSVGPARHPDVAGIMDRLRDAGIRKPPKAMNLKTPVDRLSIAARVLRGAGKESPTPEYFAAAGVENDPEAWKARLGQENQARNQARASEAREARERVDTWLRELLAEKPVPVHQVRATAAEASMPWTGGETSVSDAAHRVGVLAVETGDRIVHWTLPNRVPKGFNVLHEPGHGFPR